MTRTRLNRRRCISILRSVRLAKRRLGQQSAQKKRKREPKDSSIGRGPKGLGTKIHLVVCRLGVPLVAMLTGAQVHDSQLLEPLLEAVRIPLIGPGRPRKRPCRVCADPAYSSHSNRVYCEVNRISACGIKPSRVQTKWVKFDEQIYRERNLIERCISWLKENRRIATRFEKLAENYLAMVHLGCIKLCMCGCIQSRPVVHRERRTLAEWIRRKLQF